LGTASSGPARSVAIRQAWARHGRARKTTTLATGAVAPSTVRSGIRSWCGSSWRVSFGSGMAGYGGICHGGVRKGSSMCGRMRNHSRDRRGCTFDGAEWFLSRCGWLWRGTAWSDRFCPGGARSGVSWFSPPHGRRGSGFDARWWICGWFSYVKARRGGAGFGESRPGLASSVALCCGMSRPVEAWRGYSGHGFLILGTASKAKKK